MPIRWGKTPEEQIADLMEHVEIQHDILFDRDGLVNFIHDLKTEKRQEKDALEKKDKEDAIKHRENQEKLAQINTSTSRTQMWVAIGALGFTIFMSILTYLLTTHKIGVNIRPALIGSPLPSVEAKESTPKPQALIEEE